MFKFLLAAIMLLSVSVQAENIRTNFELSKLKSLKCTASNLFGVSQMSLTQEGQVTALTNGVPSNLKISNIGNNPALNISYINLTNRSLNNQVTSLVFVGNYLRQGSQLLHGAVFMGQSHNPFQSVYTGVPWAGLSCQISIEQ
ncbi:MAG: hypothetical protein AB7F64_08435 [Gammaproteobacteria bacterium]